uniref:MBD_C domain-containing protein n=1 Tax=Rhabditophanes sp. KR3021 TaxID=114890 RepID=A0AC35U3H3_9BILA
MGRLRQSEAGLLGIRRPVRCKVGAMKTGFDGNVTCASRSTVSIYAHPITLVHTTSKGTKKPTTEQLKKASANGEIKGTKPYQVFWAKCFENLKASVPVHDVLKCDAKDNEYMEEKLVLASKHVPAFPNIMDEIATAANLCSSLHGTPKVLIGQKPTSESGKSNSHITVICDQPYIEAVQLTDADLLEQEKKVLEARKNLTVMINTPI